MVQKSNDYLQYVNDAYVQLALAFENLHTNKELLQAAKNENSWFTEEQVLHAASVWSKTLTQANIQAWLSPYSEDFPAKTSRTVGLILAGNLPFVGLHDILSVLASGHVLHVKPSSKDTKLTEWVLERLASIEVFSDKIQTVDRISKVEAVIATGSSNSSRYFYEYFKNIPHIIRASRTSVAVLDGDETQEERELLAEDVFRYFGLGCRNVTKIYIPKGYDIRTVLPDFEGFQHYGDHHTYFNNYTYHKAIFLMNKTVHYDNGFLLIKPDEHLKSPLGCIFYEEYSNKSSLLQNLSSDNRVQCIVGKNAGNSAVPLGHSQQPRLTDYADSINTLDFLKNLS
jgi:hypothetical protein